MAASLNNVDLEKKFLSGTVLHPQTRALTTRVKATDLHPTNQVVLKAIDAILAGDAEFSAPLLVSTLISLGHAKIGNALDAGLYIKSLEGLAVPEGAVEGLAKEIYRLTVRRRMHATGLKVAKAAEEGAELKATELVAEATKIFNEQVNILGGHDNEPKDLFGTVGDFLSAETAYDVRSIASPFPTYNDLYGSFDPGNCYAFASRMKVGKSTFWLAMLQQIAAADKDNTFRALVLDTELTAEENQSRSLSAVSGVKEYFIRHKLYRKDPIMRAKVEKAQAFLAPLSGRVHHIYVGGMELEQMLTVARRWAFKHLTPGKRGLIVKDYFKLNSASDFQTKARDITFGAKVDAFKCLGKELNVPIIAFVQTNRENEDTKQGGKMLNSTVISGGDMLAQFVAMLFVLDKLSPEERQRLCPDQSIKFSHRLIPIATRQLGPDNMGKNRLVYWDEVNPTTKRTTKRSCDNYMLLNFDSFKVSECSTPTFYDLMARMQTLNVPVAAPPPEEEVAKRPLL